MINTQQIFKLCDNFTIDIDRNDNNYEKSNSVTICNHCHNAINEDKIYKSNLMNNIMPFSKVLLVAQNHTYNFQILMT
jgi:hypothetical protein